VLPDEYMFSRWEEYEHVRDCVAKVSSETGYFARKDFQWKKKINSAIFRGSNTGENEDENGEARSRLKLMKISQENRAVLDVYFSWISH